MPAEPVRRAPEHPSSDPERDATWLRYRDNLPRHLTGIRPPAELCLRTVCRGPPTLLHPRVTSG